MKTDINKLIDTLIERLYIDQIYKWTYTRDGKKLRMFHIHLQPQAKMRFGEAKRLCTHIFEKYQGIYFTLYYRHEIQQLIEQGLGRFSLICRPENKLYQNDSTQGDILLPEISVAEITKRCKSYIEIENKKTHSFLAGYHFYLSNANYAHAAFMLHQALELTLRTTLMLLSGDEKKSHCLVNTITHLKIYDSILGRLSIKDKDLAALQQLDNSYAAFRYNQGFQIDMMYLETAYYIAEKAIAWIDKYQIEYLQEIEHELKPEHIATKRVEALKNKYINEIRHTIDSNHRKLILHALEIYCEPKLVKCFAYRSQQRHISNLLLVINDNIIVHHYYLLLGLTSNQINTLDLQQKTNKLLPEHVRVTLITENEENIFQNAHEGKLFFYDVLQIGEIWFEEETFMTPDRPLTPTSLRSNTYLGQQWTKRIQNARALSYMHIGLNQMGDERAVCFALATTTEQICLGLIKIFLGYSPDVLNLNYLMELIDVIAPDASAVFYRDHTNDNVIFGLLTEVQQEFRHSFNYKVCESKVSILYERVNRFINKADNLVEEYLSHTETNINSASRSIA